MLRSLALAGATSVLVISSSPPVVAAPIEVWDYERLFKESDVVVIAAFDSSREQDQHIEAMKGKLKVKAVESKLKVMFTIKGSLRQDETVALLHWKKGEFDDPRLPSPVVFSKVKEFEIGATSFSREARYLLFLRKRDNKLEFTTGAINGVESVKELLTPSFDIHK